MEQKRQTLLLGLGGTGSRIVNYVAEELKSKGISFNDGTICCAVLDTNDNDRDKLAERGTGIPIIGTSKDRTIENYIKLYANKGVSEWMPESPSFLKESMRDGASQMRVKSRMAFFDTVEDHTIQQLERHIEKMFDKRDNAKIRVMVVSSLAGGTGAGMFIQTGLWLRKFFAKRRCAVTLRGIFVLPDVFIKTIRDISEDNTEVRSLYANAYGAIRELNAITKIKTKGLRPSQPIKIDNLFDSEDGQPDGQPVYDYAFFLDDISEGGSVLQSIDSYEQVAARLVYMQLYAPMKDDLYSEEDNLFKRFQKSPEPVFGSCGTAKAIYPTADIVRYCALRAAQDSLSTGWRRIDDEIAAKQKKEEERAMNGGVVTQRLDPRAEYVRLFDAKSSVAPEKAGSERLFVNIAHDIKDEKTSPGEDGTVLIEYLDKVEEFLARMEYLIEEKVDATGGEELKRIRLHPKWAEDTVGDADRASLKRRVEDLDKKVGRYLDGMDDQMVSMAEELVDEICTLSMGDVNMENIDSIFGMLTKEDKNNERYFVHPIAVRYLLYKLIARLDEIKAKRNLDQQRLAAQKGSGEGKKKIDFDNAKTGATESTPQEYLDSKGFLQNEARFIATFKGLYAQHNNNQCELCRAYAIAALLDQVAIALTKRLDSLVEQVEVFFKNLIKVSNSLGDAISENIRKNNAIAQKMVYVCASEEEKEALYKSLHFNTDGSDANINKIIVRALFGKFCATENPSAEANKAYVGSSVENTFFREVTRTYGEIILRKNKEEIDLDIFTAVSKSADIAAEKAAADAYEKEESDRLDVDLDTGATKADDTRHIRHLEAMRSMSDHLFDLAAPFLITDDELPENDIDDDDDGEAFTPIKKRKTFWGFHPELADKCPELAQILGVNLQLQANKEYRKNELDCYRAVYGIQACHVEKFNELKGGDYYTNYRYVVRDMINKASNGHTDELIHTPHLDKTWHLFLPYVTDEMEKKENGKFYRLFWLAVAYGMIRLSSHGKYEVRRTKTMATGSYEKYEPILAKGETIGKADVMKLITALQVDGAFMADAAKLEKRFKDECDELDSYEGTDLLRGHSVKEEGGKVQVGGLASKSETNAVTLIVRYHHTTRHNDEVTAMMIAELETIMKELVAGMYEASEAKKIEFKGYELCKRVYDASALKDKDIEMFYHWKEAWSKNSAEA